MAKTAFGNFLERAWNKTVDVFTGIFGVSDQDRKSLMFNSNLVSDKDIEDKVNKIKKMVSSKYAKLRDMNTAEKAKAQKAVDDAYDRLMTISNTNGSPFLKRYINDAKAEVRAEYDKNRAQVNRLERAEERLSEQQGLEEDLTNQAIDNMKNLAPSNQKKTSDEWNRLNKLNDSLTSQVDSLNKGNLNEYERRMKDEI